MSIRHIRMLALSATFTVMACANSTPSLPADGLTSERAIQVAQPIAQSMSSTPVQFMSQKTGQYRDFAGGGLAVPGDRWVWAEIFSGTFQSSGGPVGSSPLPAQQSVLVIIDYRTGEFIQASIPGNDIPNY